MYIFPALQRYRPDGEIGRRKGLKIPRPLDVPVRPRLGAPHLKQGLTAILSGKPLLFKLPQFQISTPIPASCRLEKTSSAAFNGPELIEPCCEALANQYLGFTD